VAILYTLKQKNHVNEKNLIQIKKIRFFDCFEIMIFINPDLNTLTFANPWHLWVVVGVGACLTEVKAYTALSLTTNVLKYN